MLKIPILDFLKQNPVNLRIEAIFLNWIMSIYKKPAANTILDSEIVTFSLKSATRQICFRSTLSLLLFSVILEVLNNERDKPSEIQMLHRKKKISI